MPPSSSPGATLLNAHSVLIQEGRTFPSNAGLRASALYLGE